jgi:hypothetical protein
MVVMLLVRGFGCQGRRHLLLARRYNAVGRGCGLSGGNGALHRGAG